MGPLQRSGGVSFFNIAPEWMFHPACRMPKSIARLGAFLHVQFLPQSAKKLNKCHFSGFIMPKKAKESKNNQCIYDLPPSSSSLRQCIKKWVHSSESTKAFQQLYPYYTCYTCFFFMVAPKYISHENVERVTVPPPKALYYDMILKHLRTYVRYRESSVNIGVPNFHGF